MTDYYLRTTNHAALISALQSANLLDEDQNCIHDLSIIGTIYEPTGRTLDDEQEMQAIDGYHANLRTREPLTADQMALLPIIDKPNNPVRVYA